MIMKRMRQALATFLDARSISFRLYLIIIPTTALAILSISYVNSRVAAILLDSAVSDNTRRVAGQLASDLAGLQTPLSADALRAWLGELVETNSDIMRIEVFRLEDSGLRRICTTSNSSAQPSIVDEVAAVNRAQILLIPQFHDRERALKVIYPVLDAAGLASGCVSVTSSLHQTEIVGEVLRKIDLFLIPASVLALVLMLHFLFSRNLTGRIGRLGLAMMEAKGGALAKRAPVDRRDELGVIAEIFNETMGEIERASRERNRLLEEQKDFNAQLREKVQEATRDLSAANLQLSQVNQDLIETQHRSTQYERMAMAGQMAAAFAHEIGSPLSTISTHLELMMEEPSCGDDARRRIQLIQAQISRITGFVEELLSETRAAAQPFSELQVNDILHQVLLFMAQHLERHGIRLETSFQHDLPAIEGHPQQLQQVFLNLINNAVDAMPAGGTIKVETRFDGSSPGSPHVLASFADSGVGISAEEQKRIFEPFFSTKDLRHGTGLGLSITARIVRQHEGTVELESEPGRGATFTIRLPIGPHHKNAPWEEIRP